MTVSTLLHEVGRSRFDRVRSAPRPPKLILPNRRTVTPPLLACRPDALPPSLVQHLPSLYRLYFLSPSPDNLPTLRPATCPPPAPPPLTLAVPTGVAADLAWVEAATVVGVWLGMVWVGWRVWVLSRRLGRKTVKVE